MSVFQETCLQGLARLSLVKSILTWPFTICSIYSHSRFPKFLETRKLVKTGKNQKLNYHIADVDHHSKCVSIVILLNYFLHTDYMHWNLVEISKRLALQCLPSSWRKILGRGETIAVTGKGEFLSLRLSLVLNPPWQLPTLATSHLEFIVLSPLIVKTQSITVTWMLSSDTYQQELTFDPLWVMLYLVFIWCLYD